MGATDRRDDDATEHGWAASVRVASRYDVGRFFAGGCGWIDSADARRDTRQRLVDADSFRCKHRFGIARPAWLDSAHGGY